MLSDGTLDNKIYTTDYVSGDSKVVDVNELFRDEQQVDKFDTQSNGFTILSTPSYPYRWSEYSSTWGYTGYLYGISSQYNQQALDIYFSTGTYVSTIGAALVAFWVSGFNVGAFLGTLGVPILWNMVASVVDGGITQYVTRWDNEVFVQSSLSLVGWYEDYTTRVYNSSGQLVDTKYGNESSGPYTDGSEMIHWGIYLYAITQ